MGETEEGRGRQRDSGDEYIFREILYHTCWSVLAGCRDIIYHNIKCTRRQCSKVGLRACDNLLKSRCSII